MKYIKLFENYDDSLTLIEVLEKLGYTKIKKIADGGSSVIYKTSIPNTIIKVTNSAISANTMQYVMDNLNGHPNFIKTKKILRVVGDVTITDSYYNYNEYVLNSYPLYVMEFEDLDRVKKSDMKNINYVELLDICDMNNITHQDLHKDNLMIRRSDGEVVMIDILDDSLPKQDIETVSIA